MKSKGFTLVELLAVIVILALLISIAIPSSLAISQKIKKKMLDTKMSLAATQAILWAQDYKKCFNGKVASCPGLSCPTDDTDQKICKVTMDKLAEDGYAKYDDGKKILNPADKNTCINNYEMQITYNKRNKTFAAKVLDTSNNECPA